MAQRAHLWYSPWTTPESVRPSWHASDQQEGNATLNTLITILTKAGLLTEDLDYHVVRAAMVILFLFFGYQKWFAYEAQVLIPYISNGPLLA